MTQGQQTLSRNSPVALLTGCSTGIGLATAIHFARKGYRVYAGVRNYQTRTDFQEAVEKEQVTLQPLDFDVTQEEQVNESVARVIEEAGRIDVLINNAGISRNGSTEELDMKAVRDLFEVNYFGAVHAIRAVVPHMRAQRSGAIVSVSSISAEVPFPCLGHYGGTKSALESLSEALSLELEEFGVRVRIVAPGATDTPMFSGRKHLRPISPKSPYLEQLKLLLQYFSWALKTCPLTPQGIAEVIEEAATSDSEQFRYLIGPGLEHLTEEGLPPRKRIAASKHVLNFLAGGAKSNDPGPPRGNSEPARKEPGERFEIVFPSGTVLRVPSTFEDHKLRTVMEQVADTAFRFRHGKFRGKPG